LNISKVSKVLVQRERNCVPKMAAVIEPDDLFSTLSFSEFEMPNFEGFFFMTSRSSSTSSSSGFFSAALTARRREK